MSDHSSAAVLDPPKEERAPTPASRRRAEAAAARDDDAGKPRTRVVRAIEAAGRGAFGDVVRMLEDEALARKGPQNLPPRALTTYALALAETNPRKRQTAIDLCRYVAEREFVDPDVYADIGHVYATCGSRELALRVVARGLTLDSTHDRLRRLHRGLGGGGAAAVLSFLAPTHAVNRFLAQLLGRRGAARGTA